MKSSTATLVGQTLDEVRHHLQEQGLLPISVRQKGWSLSPGKRQRRSQIKTEDFIVFNQQFAALIKAGLPILRSLDLLKAQIKNPILQRHVSDVRERVHSGAMLSEALRAQGVFPTVYTASIFAGERSGDLVNVINRHIHYEKTIMSVKKRFLNSLIYPAFLIVLAIVMVAVIMTFVIPKFCRPLPRSQRPTAVADNHPDRNGDDDPVADDRCSSPACPYCHRAVALGGNRGGTKMAGQVEIASACSR